MRVASSSGITRDRPRLEPRSNPSSSRRTRGIEAIEQTSSPPLSSSVLVRWRAKPRPSVDVALPLGNCPSPSSWQQGKVSDREHTDNQRETALQAYIDTMSELLLHEKLRDSAEEDEVRKIAHVRTLTILPRLNTSSE